MFTMDVHVVSILSTVITGYLALDVCKDNSNDCQPCVNTSYPVPLPYRETCMKTCGVCIEINVALSKSTDQSSEGHPYGTSDKAVDGNTNGDFNNGRSCTHTHPNSPGWWCVDLQQKYNISNILLYNRDGDQQRLQGFEMKLRSDDLCNGQGFGSAISCYINTPQTIQDIYTIDRCNQQPSTSLSARTVFVSVTGILTLCEVQIYTVQCNTGYYSTSNSTCQPCNTCYGDTCHHATGVCTGDCKPGFYGTHCRRECSDGCLNNQCNKLNGSCACKDTYYGEQCTSMCSNNCKNSRCYISSSSPQCTEGCIDGYKGLYCQSPCPGNCARCDESSCSICRSNWYGTNCESPCSIKCNGGCDIVDGRCNRCKSHAVGLFCDIECGAECKLATGGLTECEEDEPCTRNCSESTVDESSSMVTLSCLYRCIGGKKEGFCAKEYQAPTDGPDNTIIISVVTVILVLAIAAISTFLVLRYRRRRNANTQQNDKVSYVTPTNIDDIPAFAETTQISTAKTSTSENSVYVNVSGDGAYEIEESSRISLKNLLKYIKDKKTKSAYEKEYKELPGGLCSSYDYCMNAVNKPKNRYKNICAFDHSRVKLDIMNGDPNSDYINACYITGYGDHKNKYVASQGPVVDIVNEFWRMIWIVETGKIIMLTNLVEIGVHKCFRYWPKLGKEKTFGEISITMTKEDTYANFTVRTLQVTKGDSRSRTITQYHYTSWPDKGVPTDTASLVEFRNKVQTSNTAHLGPMVVHCSAGIGRTGTFIALDYLIEEAKAIDSVDIFECVKQLRYERVNMVQTLEQYAFLHDAIAEWYIAGNMSFPVTAYHVEYQKLLKVNGSTGKSELQETFEMLDDICPSLNTEDCSVALLEENKTKNRDMTVLPSDKTRIRLYKRETDSSESEYINAVFLPSYRKKTAYILTQTPLPNTIIDFWRMVLERNVTVIINMDSTEKSANIGHFLPTKGELVCGPFIITIEDEVTQDGDYYNIVTFLIRDGSDGNSEKKIKVYQCNFWDTKKKIPKSANPIFEILDDIKSWSEKNEDGPLLVHCLNGVEKSGVFCVLAAILERLTIEQDVSIIQTLLQLRLCRPQIMASYEQVKFCFDAVGVYLDEFSTYANSC